MSALHWLMKNSELYKKSGIVVDDNWFQDVTESAEDTVREFLEVSKNNVRTKTIQKMKNRRKKRPLKMTLKHPMTMIQIITVR